MEPGVGNSPCFQKSLHSGAVGAFLSECNSVSGLGMVKKRKLVLGGGGELFALGLLKQFSESC